MLERKGFCAVDMVFPFLCGISALVTEYGQFLK